MSPGEQIELMTRPPSAHPAVLGLLKFFAYQHLPERLQAISAPFAHLAGIVASAFPDSPETTVCLRKLLEAKDCAVRASL